eukprot:1738520-Pyramimonas_sp.AAC.2
MASLATCVASLKALSFSKGSKGSSADWMASEISLEKSGRLAIQAGIKRFVAQPGVNCSRAGMRSPG